MKKTKIVCTISDRNCEVSFLRKLYKAGMNVVRLNTAHISFEQAQQVIENVRIVSDRIAILVDTKGPEIRTTTVPEPIGLTAGERLMIKGDPEKESSKSCLYVNYLDFVRDVPLNSSLLIDDGSLKMVVVEKNEEYLLCEAKNDGKIESRKSINVPSVSFRLPSLSEKDREFVLFCIQQDVDFIAHSFVRNKEDIQAVQEILDEHHSQIKIIAKIENSAGVDNLDEILDCAYGAMVARGDLGIEMPYEKIPGTQKLIINKCIARRKPVIIATQMLHSMIENPRPTRAEVSDIANAIFSKTDAIMLSGETAYGRYPYEAVETMARVSREVEKSRSDIHEIPMVVLSNKRSAYLTKTAVEAAIALNAKAIIADSETGRSIRNMAGYRGRKPIFAFCYNKRTVRELSLSFGVFAQVMEETRNSYEFVSKALSQLLEQNRIKEEDLVVVIAGNYGSNYGASFIEISPVEILLNRHEILRDTKRD
ncbi:MAG: Pyruvate kinase [Syntrophus sp. PtaU1.Bin208]|nr:MAG: Pyruvate kinase [Syntrophus sp. PtaU1.Bin208]